MKMTLEFPQIMKMRMSFELNVPDSTKLEPLKKIIENKFWKKFLENFSLTARHGAIEHMALWDRDIKIVSDEILEERLKVSTCFRVEFDQHPTK